MNVFYSTINIILGEEPHEPSGYENSRIYANFKFENMFTSITNFSEAEIVDILRDMDRFAPRVGRRGPSPKIDDADAFIALLTMFASSGLDYERLTSFLGCSTTTLQSSLCRVKPRVYRALSERWFTNKIRPQPLASAAFSDIALAH